MCLAAIIYIMFSSRLFVAPSQWKWITALLITNTILCYHQLIICYYYPPCLHWSSFSSMLFSSLLYTNDAWIYEIAYRKFSIWTNTSMNKLLDASHINHYLLVSNKLTSKATISGEMAPVFTDGKLDKTWEQAITWLSIFPLEMGIFFSFFFVDWIQKLHFHFQLNYASFALHP